VEKCGKLCWTARPFSESRIPAIAMRACSGCAGDYEDPGRTAGPDEPEGEDDADEYEVELEGQLGGQSESAFERDDTPSPANENDARDDDLAN
jgi:hypothetical protein